MSKEAKLASSRVSLVLPFLIDSEAFTSPLESLFKESAHL